MWMTETRGRLFFVNVLHEEGSLLLRKEWFFNNNNCDLQQVEHVIPLVEPLQFTGSSTRNESSDIKQVRSALVTAFTVDSFAVFDSLMMS